MDYSKYLFKILEKKQVDWEGLHFALWLKETQNETEKKFWEDIVNGWFNVCQEAGADWVDGIIWNKENKALFWVVDMLKVEEEWMVKLLEKLGERNETIEKLILGTDTKEEWMNGKLVNETKKPIPANVSFHYFEPET